MSSEQLEIQNTKTQTIEKKLSARVDINTLIAKVREEKKKQRNENLVFFGLVSTVVIATGIIASL